MADDICKAFLDYSKQSSLHFSRQLYVARFSTKRHFNACPLHEPLDVSFQCRHQSAAMEGRRVEYVRDSSNLLKRLLRQRCRLGQEFLSPVAKLGQDLSQSRQVHCHGKNILSRNIVQVPCDPPPLFILQLQQVLRNLSEFRLGMLNLGYVFVHHHQPHTLIVEPCCAQLEPSFTV